MSNRQSTIDNLKWWRRTRRHPMLPNVEMTGEELQRAMAVDEATPLWRGVRELIARYQVTALDTIGDEAQPEAERQGAGVRYRAMEDLKRGMEDWRARGISELRGK
jgi:hypothetical protein